MKIARARQLARRLRIGNVLYWTLYRPRNMARNYFRYGGPAARRRMEEQRAEMIDAAWNLPPLGGWESNAKPLEVSYLTGANHWHETAFCFATFCRFSDVPLRLVLYDDGSFPEKAEEHAHTLFPHVTVHKAADLDARVEHHLPADRFPTLREWRARQPLLRKLTDLHAGSHGWKLLLDSDMVFLRRPDHLLDWLRNPRRPLYMHDVKNAYGFTHELRYSLVQKPIPDRINIGIFGLNSDAVDFAQLEDWLATMLRYEQCPYNVTQGLVSMMLAGLECDIAPAEDYIVLPSRSESKHPSAVLHHYVADSRRWYSEWGWRHALAAIRGDT